MKRLLLFILPILFISCNQMSEEDLLVHNQKVISGIEKKKNDLSKILNRINQQSNVVSAEWKKVNSFKFLRSSAKKQRQTNILQQKSQKLQDYRKRTEKLMSQLDLLHKSFEWQDHPKKVLETVFEMAQRRNYAKAIFLADPYDENDTDVDRISFIASSPKDVKDKFTNNFKNGRIIGEPFMNTNTASIEFLFGPNADKKETMKFVKRKDSWYLSSF